MMMIMIIIIIIIIIYFNIFTLKTIFSNLNTKIMKIKKEKYFNLLSLSTCIVALP